MVFLPEEVQSLALWVEEVVECRRSGPAHDLRKSHGARSSDLGTLVAAWALAAGKPQAAITGGRADDAVWP